LAFLFQDYGFSNFKKISKVQVDLAWSYMNKSLDLCEEEFGASPVINFWKKYYSMIILGEDICESEVLFFFNSGVKEAAF
tara:strand:+ start:878 stop:1117 length:240 start_codon:yes stop_codon:yes gene_type:complete